MTPKEVRNRKTARRTQQNRIKTGFILILIMSAVLLFFIVRFGYIAASGHVGAVDLSEKTKQIYQQDNVLRARRGTIYDTNANILAEDSNVYILYAVLDKKSVSAAGKPLYVTDKNKTAQVLSQYISLPADKILQFLSQKNYQVEFGSAGRNLSLDTKQKIEAAKLPGIFFTDTPSRMYPNGTFASHIVGLAQLADTKTADNISTKQLTGILGIEKYFNKALTGKNGSQISKRDSYGYNIPGSKTVTKQAVNGSDIYLSLDARLQSYLEQLMQNVQDKYQPKKMDAVLMNAKTGKIVAATQRPTFNAATKKGLGDLWRDSLVEDTYEPGSVFKLLTLSAAIDSGHYNPNATYQSGSVTIGDLTIHDWNNSGWGTIPFSEVIPRSSNTGAVAIERSMGADIWQQYLNRFHVGQKTGITLPGEASGSIQFKTPLDRAVTSFGQGIDVTVMQMMSYLSAIANGGKMLQPQIIDKTINSQGKVTNYPTKVLGQPITADTAKQVIAAMRDVVEKDYGTGSVFKIDGYENQIAVKTGTAQIAGDDGKYLTGSENYIFSVGGIAPADDPEYVLYLTVQQPDLTDTSAEKIMSEIFNPLMKRALKYRTTSANLDENAIKMPKLTGLTTAEAAKTAQEKGLTVAQVGQGAKIVQQLPAADEKVIAKQRIVLLTEGAMTMPNVVGWSKNDVLKLAEITGCQFKFSGTGYVTSQSLNAGEVLTTNKTITVKLAGP